MLIGGPWPLLGGDLAAPWGDLAAPWRSVCVCLCVGLGRSLGGMRAEVEAVVV